MFLETEKITYDPTDEQVHSTHERYKVFNLPDFAEAYSAIQDQSKEAVELYLPEPNSLKAILRLPPKQKEAWLKAYRSELKNLIINNDAFSREKPRPGEKVIPTKPIARAKQTHEGFLDKLKMREESRGDLEKHEKNEDTWSPVTSSSRVCMHLAQTTNAGRTPKQGDFIGAYLQARVRGRHSVCLSVDLAKHFPEYSEWFGIPLCLKKGMYGLILSGKWWSEVFTDWLFAEGFEQNKAKPTFFVKHY
jgi:hypothetical protein